MRRVVVVIADGLRRDLATPGTMPAITARAAAGTRFTRYAPVFPSATRVSSASFATGCRPATHGLQGNTVALLEAGRPVRHDVGDPAFFAHWRTLTGRTLRVPTLAERLRNHGGAVVWANASPGAALAHDPDGYGEVRHRAVAQGPGPVPLRHLPIGADQAGDIAMTAGFCVEVLPRRPALAVLWLGSPDFTQHQAPMGSAPARAALATADACAARVFTMVDSQRAAGDDVLLLCGADHGHETVTEVVDIDAALVAAGLKATPESDDVVVASNGTAFLLYLAPAAEARRAALAEFLAGQPWTGAVLGADRLHEVGQAPDNGLAFAVAMRADDAPNVHGVPGMAFAARPHGGKPDRLGCGQHGGLGPHETAPFLLAEGAGFAAGASDDRAASIIDIAPTVLRHLGLSAVGCEGAALQQG